jgi:hypothetical protein
MSIFQKQKDWTDYLNSLIRENNPILSGPKKNDDSVLTAGRAPVTEDTVRDELEESQKESDRVFDKMEESADVALNRGNAESERASAHSGALYDLLLGFTKKQESRYDRLLSELESGDYLASDAAKSIVDSYTARGREAAGHAAAEAAAANGGNPDTYAAWQANRQRLAFEEAGQAAAREYYTERLENLLSALRGSSADIGSLYGGLQDNVEASDKRAQNDLSIGAELLKALAAAQAKDKESTLDVLSQLAGKTEAGEAISPMEIDLAYNALMAEEVMGKKKHTPTTALKLLWDRYPAMREYIAKKYEDVVGPYHYFEG